MSTAAAKERSESAAIPFTLGASGVVYSVYTVVALAYPDTELAMKIPPTFPIPISYGLSALLVFDVLGVIRGWTSVMIPRVWLFLILRVAHTGCSTIGHI